MTQIVTSICRMCTKDDERTFAVKIQELSDIKPSLIGLNKFFTLDETSEIRQIFHKQFGHLLLNEENEMVGDSGGSSVQINITKEKRTSSLVGSITSSKHNKTVEVITEVDENEDEEESKHEEEDGNNQVDLTPN